MKQVYFFNVRIAVEKKLSMKQVKKCSARENKKLEKMTEKNSNDIHIDWDKLLSEKWNEQKDVIQKELTDEDIFLGLIELICTETERLLSEKERISEVLVKFEEILKREISQIFALSDELNRILTRAKRIVEEK